MLLWGFPCGAENKLLAVCFLRERRRREKTPCVRRRRERRRASAVGASRPEVRERHCVPIDQTSFVIWGVNRVLNPAANSPIQNSRTHASGRGSGCSFFDERPSRTGAPCEAPAHWPFFLKSLDTLPDMCYSDSDFIRWELKTCALFLAECLKETGISKGNGTFLWFGMPCKKATRSAIPFDRPAP